MTRLLDRPATPVAIAEATKSSSQPRTLRREAQRHVLLVRCGAEWFALNAADVVHVCSVRRVHALPHRTTPAFRGVATIAGAVIPVVNIKAILGLAEAPTTLARSPRMVQVGTSAASFAFEADEVPGVLSILLSSVRELPMTVEKAPRRIGTGLVTTTHGSVTLVDSALMLAEFSRAMGA